MLWRLLGYSERVFVGRKGWLPDPTLKEGVVSNVRLLTLSGTWRTGGEPYRSLFMPAIIGSTRCSSRLESRCGVITLTYWFFLY